jgi:hypothetical protein
MRPGSNSLQPDIFGMSLRVRCAAAIGLLPDEHGGLIQ